MYPNHHRCSYNIWNVPSISLEAVITSWAGKTGTYLNGRRYFNDIIFSESIHKFKWSSSEVTNMKNKPITFSFFNPLMIMFFRKFKYKTYHVYLQILYRNKNLLLVRFLVMLKINTLGSCVMYIHKFYCNSYSHI